MSSIDSNLPFMLSTSPSQDAKTFLPDGFHLRRPDTPKPVLWHGSSKLIKKKATRLIEKGFDEVGFLPCKKMGSRLYLLTVLEDKEVKCCLRCILDGDWDHDDEDEDDKCCYHRLVIEYVCTTKDRQGRGYASFLLELMLDYGHSQQANTYALALESAFAYWLRKGFAHTDDEYDADIQERLCLFDCDHLMKLPSNRPEDPELNETSSNDDSDGESDSEDSEASFSSIIQQQQQRIGV